MFFKIAPDSLLNRNRDKEQSFGARVMRWIWLIWLLWLFGPAFLGTEYPTRFLWFWPTMASLVVFGVLYVRAYTDSRRNIVWYAIGVAVLAALITPVNPYGETYLIYACAIAAWWGSARRSFGLMIILMILYGVEWLLLGIPWPWLVNAWVLCLVVGGLNIFQRQEHQRQAELRLSHDEIRRLAATAERERIGRDLHDLLGHTLSLVAVKSELAKRLLERDDPQAARREIAEVERVAREALAQVRSAVTGIRAAALVSELASARLLLESAGVAFDYHAPESHLPAEIETALALALREAVTTIQRHARATRAQVEFVFDDRSVRMRVRDDGRGGIGAHGNGLTGMRERIEAMGGTLSIQSERGHGTQLEITLPVPVAQENPAPLAAAREKISVAALRHA